MWARSTCCAFCCSFTTCIEGVEERGCTGCTQVSRANHAEFILTEDGHWSSCQRIILNIRSHRPSTQASMKRGLKNSLRMWGPRLKTAADHPNRTWQCHVAFKSNHANSVHTTLFQRNLAKRLDAAILSAHHEHRLSSQGVQGGGSCLQMFATCTASANNLTTCTRSATVHRLFDRPCLFVLSARSFNL